MEVCAEIVVSVEHDHRVGFRYLLCHVEVRLEHEQPAPRAHGSRQAVQREPLAPDEAGAVVAPGWEVPDNETGGPEPVPDRPVRYQHVAGRRVWPAEEVIVPRIADIQAALAPDAECRREAALRDELGC